MWVVHEVDLEAEVLDAFGERDGVVHRSSAEVQAVGGVGVHADETNLAHLGGDAGHWD